MSEQENDEMDFGCHYPGVCVMPGEHMKCECATPEMSEMADIRAEVSRLTKERDSAISEMSKNARLLGLTEAKVDALLRVKAAAEELILFWDTMGVKLGGRGGQLRAALSALGDGKV